MQQGADVGGTCLAAPVMRLPLVTVPAWILGRHHLQAAAPCALLSRPCAGYSGHKSCSCFQPLTPCASHDSLVQYQQPQRNPQLLYLLLDQVTARPRQGLPMVT